jgi:hypothetical protein
MYCQVMDTAQFYLKHIEIKLFEGYEMLRHRELA